MQMLIHGFLESWSCQRCGVDYLSSGGKGEKSARKRSGNENEPSLTNSVIGTASQATIAHDDTQEFWCFDVQDVRFVVAKEEKIGECCSWWSRGLDSGGERAVGFAETS